MPSLDHTSSNPLQLIVCDNDGCLLPEGPVILEPDVLAPIAAYNRAAFAPGSTLPPLTVCTGRPLPFVELQLRLIQCSSIPAVCEHGGYLYTLEENVAHLDPSISANDRAALREAESWMRDESGLIIQAGKDAMISAYLPDEAEMVEHLAGVREEIDRNGWPLLAERSAQYLNVTLRHVSKATALSRLFEQAGVEGERVLAIGDTHGDLVMGEVCGTFACPANSVEDVKQAADYVSPYPMLEGVLDIIRRFTGWEST